MADIRIHFCDPDFSGPEVRYFDEGYQKAHGARDISTNSPFTLDAIRLANGIFELDKPDYKGVRRPGINVDLYFKRAVDVKRDKLPEVIDSI